MTTPGWTRRRSWPRSTPSTRTIYDGRVVHGHNVQMAFGQGGTAITPIEEAVAYATFANGGTRYVPQIAAGIVTPTGKVVKTFAPKVAGHVALSAADHPPCSTASMGRSRAPAPGTGRRPRSFAGLPLQQAVAGRQDRDGQCHASRSRRRGSWAGAR